MSETKKSSTIQQLQRRLTLFVVPSVDIEDLREEFKYIVCDIMEIFGLKPVDLSEVYGASIQTVLRWMKGLTCPTPALVRVIAKDYLKQLDELEADD